MITGGLPRVVLLVQCLIIGIAGCTRLPPQPESTEGPVACSPAHAVVQTDSPSAPHGPLVESEFLPVHQSDEALEWRLAMVDSAQHSLDVQYFIWRADDTGRLLAYRLYLAAERGVKVRLLVDDILLAGRDAGGVLLNSHPNLEVRVFNPFRVRGKRPALRNLELLSRLSRMNHRMHNKLLLADNKAGIVGGRNIGNEYFGLGSNRDFRDLDLVALGPVVAQLAESFDVFWHSAWTYPIDTLSKKKVDPEQLAAAIKQVADEIAQSPVLHKIYSTVTRDWSSKIAIGRKQLIPGRARVLYDCPPGTLSRRPEQTAVALREVARATKQELFLISPYMILQKPFRSGLRAMIDDGVRVRILTNSLESADHTIAVAGYSKRRRELLKMGVEIYELRAYGDNWQRYRTPYSQGEYLSLHAKVIIFDRSKLYVGTMNIDPRSQWINTEIGLYIESEALASAILREFERDTLPNNSYAVRLDEDGRVVWHSSEGERHLQPARSLSQRIAAFFYALLPVESQL